MQSASATLEREDLTSRSPGRNALRQSAFVMTRDNVLWLLSCRDFYRQCPSFAPFLGYVEKLSEFIQHVNEDGPSCKKCDTARAYKAQAQLLDAFAGHFIALYDAGRLDELRRIRAVLANNGRRVDRIVLAYAGKSTKNQSRVVTIE